MATIFDVARRANVSITTVSHVFSGKRVVAGTTRERVLEVAKELNYAPSRAALGLAMGRAFTLAILLPDPLQHCLVNPAFVELVLTITEECSLAGYSTLVYGVTPGTTPDELRSAIEKRSIDGILWIDPTTHQEEPSRFLSACGVPLVVGGTPVDPERIPHVRNDRYEVACLALNHLQGLGHRQVGLVAGPKDLMVAVDYSAAFADVAAGLGIELTATYTDGWTIRDGRVAVDDLVRECPRITAVVSLNEAMAVGLIQEAHERGLRVPQRLSIISIGNTHLAEHFVPGITAIEAHSREMGQMLVRRMLHMISGQAPSELLTLVPATLVVRDSTAIVSQQHVECRAE